VHRQCTVPLIVRGNRIDGVQESNIILAKTYEYRVSTENAKKEAVERQQAGEGAGKANMTSRFLGLVVVPGQHITKLEVEEKKPWELPLRPG
jgi:N-alpha-acetyltransferase 38, NatC auxiliary subunit